MIGRSDAQTRRPLIGVLCCNRIVDERASQVVADRFIHPLTEIAGAQVLIVPAMPGAIDAIVMAGILDGLLLTGSCSNVDPERYGGAALPEGQRTDVARDAVSFALAGAMMEAGRPVFGICRGMQELNVLFGGSLTAEIVGGADHFRSGASQFDDLFDHSHEIDIEPGGVLADLHGEGVTTVNSVHLQGVARLGKGLRIEARAHDGLIEAFSASPAGAPVIGVQWHPEWHAARSSRDRAFFEMAGRALRGDRLAA